MSAQTMAALDYGNEIRLASVVIRADVAALDYHEGLLRTATLLLDPPAAIQHTRVDRLVESIRRVGPEKMIAILEEVRIHPHRYVGPAVGKSRGHKPLTEGQRWRLACELRRRAA